jgi:phosphoglycerate kinase
MNLITMNELDLANKNVLIREDLNVPIKDGIITSDKRLQAALPTIQLALEKNAAVILLSHLGRPEEGFFEEKYSLTPIAEYLSEHLKIKVRFEKDYLDGITINPGEVILCENVRFNQGEKTNDEALAKKLANLCDIFIMDAFGTAHRAHASTYGVAKYAPVSAAGPLLEKELNALSDALESPQKPIAAVVGGSKVSSKLSLLKQLINRVDYLIVGGGIANTFLKATGVEIGNSLYEHELLPEANAILELAKKSNCHIPLPEDVVVGKSFSQSCPAYNKSINQIASDDMIMDIGPDTVSTYESVLEKAQTIIWNGPVGVFEFPSFAFGTKALAFAIAESEAFSIAGGGDTLAAIDQCGLSNKISYISTGGGAFLEFLEGKKLPAVKILEQRATCETN